jgi:hypothetical protein
VELDPEAASVEIDDDALDEQMQQLALLLRDERVPQSHEAVEQARHAFDLALGPRERAQAIFDLPVTLPASLASSSASSLRHSSMRCREQ